MPWKRVVSKGPYGNHVLNDHREAIICRDDKSVKRFKPGDIAWIKVRDCCWWPWQMLKQENLSIRDAFQKAMDESKEEVTETRDIAPMDARKGKKLKQDEIKRIDTDESPPSPAVSSSETEEASAMNKTKDESKVKATADSKGKQDGTKNLLVYVRTRRRASEDPSAKEGAHEPNIKEKPVRKREIEAIASKRIMQEKRTNLQACASIRRRASRGQSTEQEAAREPNDEEKAGSGAAKVEETPKLASNVTKRKVIEEKIAGKQKPEAQTSNGDPNTKYMTGGTSKQPKPKVGWECPAEKVGDDASRGKTDEQGVVRKANVTEKAKVSPPKGKILKQEDVKEPTQTKGPGTTVIIAPEESASNRNERRIRVMQSLGLIAPLGSPYGR